MRFLAAAVLGTTLLTIPAMAALPGQNGQPTAPAAPHNFGGVNCSVHVQCPDDTGFTISDSYIDGANTCVTQYMGFTNTDGFFDNYKGLDSNYCLSAKANALPKLTSTRTEPHCCVVKAADNSCSYHCDLVTVP